MPPQLMNTSFRTPVEPAVRVWLRRISLLFTLAALGGCVEVSGAAAELSWSIRSFEGDPVAGCSDARIERVQIRWISEESRGDEPLAELAADGFEEFECAANRGVTDFDIGAGRQLLWIVPVCEQSQTEPESSTYSVPPPIARDMRNGEVVTLSSLLIVIDATPCSMNPDPNSSPGGTCCPDS